MNLPELKPFPANATIGDCLEFFKTHDIAGIPII